MLGMLTMPYAMAQLLLNLLFLPIMLVVAGVTLAQGDWQARRGVRGRRVWSCTRSSRSLPWR